MRRLSQGIWYNLSTKIKMLWDCQTRKNGWLYPAPFMAVFHSWRDDPSCSSIQSLSQRPAEKKVKQIGKRHFLISQSAERGLWGMIIHQPEAIFLEAFYLLLETCDVIIMDYNLHSFSFLYPCLVFEVQSSSWKCCLRQQVEIHLQKSHRNNINEALCAASVWPQTD